MGDRRVGRDDQVQVLHDRGRVHERGGRVQVGEHGQRHAVAVWPDLVYAH
jgi:hypothetical protein